MGSAMPPQDPYGAMPQPAPTMPTPQPVFVPAGQPPQKQRRKLVIVALAILVVFGAAGYAAYAFLLSPGAKAPAANAGPMHVGSYPYVNACNAFTTDDFESVAGTKSDRSLIEAEFAKETDAGNPGRSYRSTCVRFNGDGSSITATIYQYADTKLTEDQKSIFGLNDAKSDPEIGGLARSGSLKFTFQKGNKVVVVLAEGFDDISDSQIQTLAKAAAKKVSSRLAGSSELATLTYPAELAGEGYVYQNACTLWGADDFEGQFGHVDKTTVKMTYAEELVAEAQLPSDAAQSAHSRCVLGTKEVGGSFAYVDTYYYPNTAKAEAGYNSYLHPGEDMALTGLGEKAVLQAYDASANQYETVMVLRGTTMFKAQFVPQDNASRGNGQVQSDVKAMAQTVLTRLK